MIKLGIFAALIFLPFTVQAQKNKKQAPALELQPGLYQSSSKTFLNGKLSDPLLQAKKEVKKLKGPQREQKIKDILALQNSEVCITRKMLEPKNFYPSFPDARYCQYTLKRAEPEQITADFDCGPNRGKGTVTTRVLDPNSYESAYYGGKGPKGEKLKIVTSAKKIADQCSTQSNQVSGKVFGLDSEEPKAIKKKTQKAKRQKSSTGSK